MSCRKLVISRKMIQRHMKTGFGMSKSNITPSVTEISQMKLILPRRVVKHLPRVFKSLWYFSDMLREIYAKLVWVNVLYTF